MQIDITMLRDRLGDLEVEVLQLQTANALLLKAGAEKDAEIADLKAQVVAKGEK